MRKSELRRIIRGEIARTTQLNEGVGNQTYKIPTPQGILNIEVEYDNAGIFVDVIFNKSIVSTTDIPFPTGNVNVTTKTKKVKLSK